MSKFYPLTPSMSKKLRKSKLTKHEMALWLYLIEKDPFGDRYWQLPSTLEITAELEMSKASYFRAKARLQELELFDFQEQRVDCRNLTGVSKMRLESQNLDLESQKCDSKSQKCDSESQKCDSKSQKRDSRRSKSASNKDSSNSQTIQTYSDFINTLSEGEREEFLKFGEKKAAQLPHPPQLSKRWIQTNWEELSAQWYKSKGQSSPAQSSKWETDPRTRDWLAIIEETANPLEFATDKEKIEFVKWAKKTNQFSWLREEES
ncbi:hypothetical protein VB735_33800 [Halotia wernerae UHCC 0503]|nr:hypothetical protein [Halotia wernerae UHCC 0503]